MLVLTVTRPDAFEEEGVRAGDELFVVRRGWLNDILSGQVLSRLLVGTAAGLGSISLVNPEFMQRSVSHRTSQVPDTRWSRLGKDQMGLKQLK